MTDRWVPSMAAILALALPTSALAQGDGPRPRIVNGSGASQGEYPAQGLLSIDTNGIAGYDSFCGGTLVGPRQFLTAAHCTTNEVGVPLPANRFRVRLGNIDRTPAVPDDYFPTTNDVNSDYDALTTQNDTAMLTLDRVASYTPLRVARSDEGALWDPGTIATVIGWGRTSSGGPNSEFLLEASVPIITDSRCSDAYGSDFDPETMVCAADPEDTPDGEAHDTCNGDSGGPLMVPAGDGTLALVGLTSWGIGCADPANPGVYARLGDDPLNAWVRGRIPSGEGPGGGEPGGKTNPGTTTSQSNTQPMPIADLASPNLRLAARRQRLLTALRRGFASRVNCNEACRLGATLVISKRAARRLRMSEVVARGSSTLAPAGTRSLGLKFSWRARSRLKGAPSVGVTLKLTAVDAAGNRRALSRRFRLRR